VLTSVFLPVISLVNGFWLVRLRLVDSSSLFLTEVVFIDRLHMVGRTGSDTYIVGGHKFSKLISVDESNTMLNSANVLIGVF